MALSHLIPARRSAPLTEAALCAWVGRAAPGDRLAYHRGFLAWDLSPELSTQPKPVRAELARVAARARCLADAGSVHLVQRREGPGDYTYLLIARRRPRTDGGAVLQQVLAMAAVHDTIMVPPRVLSCERRAA